MKTQVLGFGIQFLNGFGCDEIMKKTHGMSKTRFYSIWADMKKRCNNVNSINYKFYGEKGITYQNSWEFFKNFYNDMFSDYNDALSLDRIDPTGNYTKENCRWIQSSLQNKNKGMYCTNSIKESNCWIIKNKGVETLGVGLVSPLGKKVKKTFSLNKFTIEEAIRLAKIWLDEKRKEFGYFEKHGVK